eukprot:3555427-Amphidinium_carterae.2
MDARVPRYKQISGVTAEGEHFSVQLKAHCYTSGLRYLELYAPLQYLVSWATPKMSRILERDLKQWTDTWGGLDGQHVRRSLNSKSKSGAEGSEGPNTQEYMCSSRSFLDLPLWWSLNKGKAKDRQAGQDFGEVLFENALSLESCLSRRFVTGLDIERACPHARDGGRCAHLDALAERVEQLFESGLTPQRVLFRALVHMRSNPSKCPSLALFYTEWFARVLTSFDTEVDTWSSDTVAAFAASAESNAKRRRLDEDLRTHHVSRVAKASGSHIEFHAPSGTTHTWIIRLLQCYLERAREGDFASQSLSVAFDASRFAGEETTMYLACAPATDQTLWLAPQVQRPNHFCRMDVSHSV